MVEESAQDAWRPVPRGGSRVGRSPVEPEEPDAPRKSISVAVALIALAAGALWTVHWVAPASGVQGHGPTVRIVAAENFWGSLVAQLGGSNVSVLSIVSDPNADPHEYETNTLDAIAIANAAVVIENGAGYDDWCQQLVSAGNNPNQVVLNVASVLGKVAGDNPHFWYGTAYVTATIAAMYAALVAVDRADTSYFQQRYAALNASLAPVASEEAAIRASFAGTPVASTESIFVYLANSTGLDLVSPPAFMDAVAEGVDPPAASITQFQDQLAGGNVSVLVYNAQTVIPVTEQMLAIAAAHNVPVVPVTETIQPGTLSYQAWMLGQLVALHSALAA